MSNLNGTESIMDFDIDPKNLFSLNGEGGNIQLSCSN
jgi:hypothetical protein